MGIVVILYSWADFWNPKPMIDLIECLIMEFLKI